VAIYIRWSTEDQGQGHTLAIQQESCRYYCLSQGWTPSGDLTFIDDGYSGSTLHRPALTRLRDAVGAGKVSIVVVYKLDRLSRNIKDMINLVLDEWEDRCAVRSTQEPVDTTSDAGRMFFTMLGSFADFERATIRTRTWSGKRKSAELGRNPGMQYSYGYRKAEAGGWAVDEPEAAVVRRVYAEYLQGRSCRLIAFGLNAEGFRTRSGHLWAEAGISRLLRSPLYAGRLVYNRRTTGGRHPGPNPPDAVIAVDNALPAIISAEAWAQVEHVRNVRPRCGRPQSGSPRAHSSAYLLAGLLRCPCGKAWVGIQGGRRGERFYACAGARSGGPAACPSRSVRAAMLDQLVLEQVREQWPASGWVQSRVVEQLSEDLRGQEQAAEALRQRLRTVQAAEERYKRDYRRGSLPAELFTSLLQEAQQEREELQARVQEAEAAHRHMALSRADLGGAARAFARLDQWAALDLPQQQQILRSLIHSVSLSRPKGTRDIAVQFAWRLPEPVQA